MWENTFVSESIELRNLGFVVSTLEDTKKIQYLCCLKKKKTYYLKSLCELKKKFKINNECLYVHIFVHNKVSHSVLKLSRAPKCETDIFNYIS